MFANPTDEWRALTSHYRSMVDEELLELAADFHNLTPTAQQVLRDEMRLRTLGDPQAPGARTNSETANATSARIASENLATIADAEGGAAVEYTWKAPLCQCDSQEQAWQIGEALKRMGIESWIDPPRYYSPNREAYEPGEPGPRVLVAADQLDQAHAIASQPIPADIVEQSKIAPPEFEPPVCPRCGAADPLLEDVEPVNAWKCEACGAEWTDPEPDADRST